METIVGRRGGITKSYARQEIALAEYRELVSTKKMQACSSSDSLSKNLVEETYVSFLRATLCHTRIKKVTILPLPPHPSRVTARSSDVLSNDGYVRTHVRFALPEAWNSTPASTIRLETSRIPNDKFGGL